MTEQRLTAREANPKLLQNGGYRCIPDIEAICDYFPLVLAGGPKIDWLAMGINRFKFIDLG